jgi:hypothetical protein
LSFVIFKLFTRSDKTYPKEFCAAAMIKYLEIVKKVAALDSYASVLRYAGIFCVGKRVHCPDVPVLDLLLIHNNSYFVRRLLKVCERFVGADFYCQYVSLSMVFNSSGLPGFYRPYLGDFKRE